MALIFATLTVALACLLYAPRWIALLAALACLTLSTGLFLFEIHNPTEGFGMPWLQVRAGPAVQGRAA